MATFPEVCFWELSYVNVPTVNLKSYSMNAANHTHYSYKLHRIAHTCYMYQPLDMINQQTAVHHVSKILLLRLVLATSCIDERQHSDLF